MTCKNNNLWYDKKIMTVKLSDENTLKGKTILLGISGGIAAYKVPELVRKLRKAEAEVQVIMTKNAQEFITPLTFQTISNNPVITEMFAPVMTSEVAHVSLADKSDLVVVAPATANVIAKFAVRSQTILFPRLCSYLGSHSACAGHECEYVYQPGDPGKPRDFKKTRFLLCWPGKRRISLRLGR